MLFTGLPASPKAMLDLKMQKNNIEMQSAMKTCVSSVISPATAN
jgi:hypothetical protein